MDEFLPQAAWQKYQMLVRADSERLPLLVNIAAILPLLIAIWLCSLWLMRWVKA